MTAARISSLFSAGAETAGIIEPVRYCRRRSDGLFATASKVPKRVQPLLFWEHDRLAISLYESTISVQQPALRISGLNELIVSPKGYQADDDRAREEAPNTAARLVGSNKGVLMEASHEISAESGTNRKTIYDVGVLVVHGIGQQRKSETVNSYAGAMYEWVRDRLRGSQEDHAHRNSPGNAQQTNPPHT